MRWDDIWEEEQDEKRKGNGRGRRKREEFDEDKFGRLERSARREPGPRKFSLDFLSKMQKQTVVAVLLFLVVLSAKYGSDTASGLIYKTFQTALSPANDYSVALNELTKGMLGGQDTVTVTHTGVTALMPVEGTVARKFGRQLSNGVVSNNQGIDIAAPLGSNVLAPMDGSVTAVGRDTTLGVYVRIDHGNGLSSLLSNFAQVRVKAGEKVVKGQELGALGFTSSIKQPWLHWEVRSNNRLIDPQSLDIEPAKKV